MTPSGRLNKTRVYTPPQPFTQLDSSITLFSIHDRINHLTTDWWSCFNSSQTAHQGSTKNKTPNGADWCHMLDPLEIRPKTLYCGVLKQFIQKDNRKLATLPEIKYFSRRYIVKDSWRGHLSLVADNIRYEAVISLNYNLTKLSCRQHAYNETLSGESSCGSQNWLTLRPRRRWTKRNINSSETVRYLKQNPREKVLYRSKLFFTRHLHWHYTETWRLLKGDSIPKLTLTYLPRLEEDSCLQWDYINCQDCWKDCS